MNTRRAEITQFLINNYFSETTLSHFKSQQELSERYQRRAIDVTLAAKLILTYGKYHLAMLHRQLVMSDVTGDWCLSYLFVNFTLIRNRSEK